MHFSRGWHNDEEEVGDKERQEEPEEEIEDELASEQAQSWVAEAQEAQSHEVDAQHPQSGQQTEEECAEEEAIPRLQSCAKKMTGLNSPSCILYRNI